MEKPMEDFVLDIIDQGKDLTLATVRPDGYPQATTVSYAHDGMTIYAAIGKESQKAHNIRQNNKVSLTINNDYEDWDHIKGLSMAAVAELIEDDDEMHKAADCMLKRYPQLSQWSSTVNTDEIAFLRIRPQVISVLDYQKGFGHTDLVRV
ncbi:MAG TPA: pyridoxamine 5'-phosphate oxidase family protein [Noviherbaspirillum sp.]